MKRILKRISIGTAIVGSGVLALGVASYAIGARVNTSKSIPLGLYWTSDKPVEKGAYVLFCPPQLGIFAEAKTRGYLASGFCPGDYGYMMKRVLAAKNDSVAIGEDGVRVNGRLLQLSVPLAADRGGRPLHRFPAAQFIVGNSEVFLMSDVSGTSFDGRYFGPINRSQIRTVIVPVLTW